MINENEIRINNNEIYYKISSLYRNIYFYLINISLLKSEDIDLRKNFKFIIYQGLLNKINSFINFTSNKPYFI